MSEREAAGKDMRQWRQSLRDYVFPKIGNLPVSAIDTALVIGVLQPIWSVVPETASRVRGRIEAVLGWATVNGLREGDNPARWKNHLDKRFDGRDKRGQHAAMPYKELPAWLAGLRGEPGVVARPLEFLVLTAARFGEAAGARWREIDFEARVWTVPPERMKARREHRVPLSDAAIACLGDPGKPDALVFAGRFGGRPSQPQLLERCNPYTMHGMRSTFRVWAGDAGFQPDVIEHALAHQVGSAAERAYSRGDLFERRRVLMDAWSRFALGEDEAEVVRLRPAG
jgi:integrase